MFVFPKHLSHFEGIGAPSVENLLFRCTLVENLITNHGHILSSWLLLASSLLLACGKACI